MVAFEPNQTNADRLQLHIDNNKQLAGRIQVQRVAVHLARTQAMVEALTLAPLHDELEPAEIYCPAPFPPGDACALPGAPT